MIQQLFNLATGSFYKYWPPIMIPSLLKLRSYESSSKIVKVLSFRT